VSGDIVDMLSEPLRTRMEAKKVDTITNRDDEPSAGEVKRMPYGTIVMDSGDKVLFEVEGPYVGPVSDEGVLLKLEQRFDHIMDVVQQTAQSAHSTLEKIPKPSRPTEYEVKFGLKITADAGAVFAKVGTEGTFEMTLRWGS
jgi:hypothetical protein